MKKDADIIIGICIEESKWRMFVAEIRGIEEEEDRQKIQAQLTRVLGVVTPLAINPIYIDVKEQGNSVVFRVKWLMLANFVIERLSVMFPFFSFYVQRYKKIDEKNFEPIQDQTARNLQ